MKAVYPIILFDNILVGHNTSILRDLKNSIPQIFKVPELIRNNKAEIFAEVGVWYR